MKVSETAIVDVRIFHPNIYHDERGFFLETYQLKKYGIQENFVQDNFSRSKKNVLRGLHYQLPHAQGKFVYVMSGHVLDVIVDIRLDSPTFGKSIMIELNDKNFNQIYIPPGCAHGFCVLSDYADFFYKCTDYYFPEGEKGILWNDPALNIKWPVNNPTLTKKDSEYPLLKEVLNCDLPRYTRYT